MSPVKISVVIPVCNVEKYVGKCLQSVMDQTLKDIEIICVNDGSRDNSLKILQEFQHKDSRIRIVDKKNTGYGNSMNIGFSKAQGEYISVVESDDFIKNTMMEELWEMTENGKIDVVKGNFWDYYEKQGKEIAKVNTERDAMGKSTEAFTIAQKPNLLWGHPSIWSAIYRRQFLLDNNIHFMEEPGGGWVDNPFFFETLLLARSIKWTAEPFYYYRKTNENSSSNKQPDLTLPLRRMMDNLDVVEKYHYQDETTLKLVYSRALMYLYGVLCEKGYTEQMDAVKSYARKLFARLNPSVLEDNFNLLDQKTYHIYLSPFDNLLPNKQKILIYNWVQFDNPHNVGGGVNVYCRNLINTILNQRPDVYVYFLSSGFAYDASQTECYIRGTHNMFGDRCRSFEVVNSPVPSAQNMIINDPSIAIRQQTLQKVFKDFLAKNGPFAAIHFNNIEGLSLDCLDLKKDLPDTKLVFSLHNYVPFCVHGFYFDRVKEQNCTPDHTLQDCIQCTNYKRRSDISIELYSRAVQGASREETIERKSWIEQMNFNRLDQLSTQGKLTDFNQKAVEVLNKNMDVILAVSNRVKKLALDNGFTAQKVQTSYIGTRIADYVTQNHPVGLKGSYFKLGYLGSDIYVVEKGYQFLMETLGAMDPQLAAKVDLFLTTTNGDAKAMKAKLSHFHSVTIKKGYRHSELKDMLHDVDLGVVPVLWEDNLPQIAIEMVAMGVPVLSSSFGGASELCDSPLFKFQGGSKEDFLAHLTRFINNPQELGEYWKHNRPLVTFNQHWAELERIYNLKPHPESVSVGYEDFVLLQRENDFLRKNFSDFRYDYDQIRNSLSFKLGRMITFVPRNVRNLYKYERVHGAKYTIGKVASKLKALF